MPCVASTDCAAASAMAAAVDRILLEIWSAGRTWRDMIERLAILGLTANQASAWLLEQYKKHATVKVI